MEHESNTDLHPLHINSLQNNFQWTSTQTFNSLITMLAPTFDWDKVWISMSLASRNPAHQQIHFNFVHRVYLTPRKLHMMKLIDDPKCTLCSSKVIGSYFHMFWACTPVADFWKMIALKFALYTCYSYFEWFFRVGFDTGQEKSFAGWTYGGKKINRHTLETSTFTLFSSLGFNLYGYCLFGVVYCQSPWCKRISNRGLAFIADYSSWASDLISNCNLEIWIREGGG